LPGVGNQSIAAERGVSEVQRTEGSSANEDPLTPLSIFHILQRLHTISKKHRKEGVNGRKVGETGFSSKRTEKPYRSSPIHGRLGEIQGELQGGSSKEKGAGGRGEKLQKGKKWGTNFFQHFKTSIPPKWSGGTGGKRKGKGKNSI